MVRSTPTKRRKISDTNDNARKKREEEDSIEIASPPNIVPVNRSTGSMDVDLDLTPNVAAATPTRSNQRSKSSRRKAEGAWNDTLEVEDEETNDEAAGKSTRTPSVRSSGRQRKAPKRFEDEILEKKRNRSIVTKAAKTPSKPISTNRSPERQSFVLDEEDTLLSAKSITPQKRVKRQSVKPSTTNTGKEAVVNGYPEAIDGDDDTDDIVNAQLQQELLKELTNSDERTSIIEPLPVYAEKLEELCRRSKLYKELKVMTRLILAKLSGKRRIPLKGIDNEYRKVFQLIEQTVIAGEGNSLLIMGARGCAKTAVVESIISTLSQEHKDDFHVVHLNGLLHTDDRLAVREIWRQLGRETNTEDEAAKVNNYADTMSTLLALLSHPEELYGSKGSPGAIATAKSVIIVLDEFDLFATHPRQTLLYNLFDIAQARKAPLAVIGVTTKVDVTEMLEKRVKSRFSHRYVFLPLPKTLETFSEICLAALDMNEQEILDDNNPDGDLDTSCLMTSNGSILLGEWSEYLKVS